MRDRILRRLFHLPRWLLALAAALVLSGCGFLADFLIHDAHRLLASDLYTFLIAFLFTYALLRLESHRRRVLSRRMEIAADVNHHIRNALTGIVYTAAVQNDPALQAVLKDATERIDWVLNTVLPGDAVELRWPVQAPDWRPSPWEIKARPESPLPDHLHSESRQGTEA